MDVTSWVALALAGAAFFAGWIDAVVGGGGLIQLPALLIGLPQSVPVATVSGTNKVASACGTAMASATYLRKVHVDWRSAVPLMVLAWVGSSIGARLTHYLPRQYFSPIVLVALVLVGWYTYRRPQLGLEQRLTYTGRAHYGRLCALGLAVGLYDGFVGPGTGTFFVIGLVGLLGYGFLEASTLTKLANLTTNLAALSVFAFSGHVLWRLGLVMAAANVAGGFLGARTALRHGNSFVRRIFLVAITLLGAQLAWQTLRLFI